MLTNKLSNTKLKTDTRNNFSIFFYLVSLIIFVMLSSASNAGEFAVSPMMIDLNGEARSEQEFSFNLYGKSSTNVKLDFYNMTQLESGYMGFEKASMDNLENVSSWVELDDDNYRLRDGDVIQVNGTINIPSRASGTHLLAIMVEEDLTEEKEGGIAVKIRYAVVLNLNIEGRRSRIETSFEELAVVETEDGLFLEGYFTNNSTIEDWLYSEVQIRDENNRLHERVALQTQSSWQRADTGSRVFPGARVRVYGQITEAPSAGQYNIMVRNNFADRSQPVYRDILAFENTPAAIEENTELLAELIPEGELLVNPGEVDIEIRQNNTSFSSFYIENTKAEPINIKFPESLDNLDTLGVSTFEFYPANVEVKPNQKVRVVLRQTHLAGIEYGNIIFPADAISADVRSTITIPTIARN